MSCPSCGGEVELRSKVSLYAVCPYCTSLVLRRDLDVEKVGVLGALMEDGTPIRLGTCGRYKGRAFEVIGRIQLEYRPSPGSGEGTSRSKSGDVMGDTSGFWNEWYLSFGGETGGWLGEASGLYAVSFLVEKPGNLPSWEQLTVGGSVAIGGDHFIVSDIERARCVGGEGELPFAIESGYEAPVVDLVTHGRDFATIDYSETPPLAFVGDLFEFHELSFKELREVPGW